MKSNKINEKFDGKFAFFHATSVSGTAMMMLALISTYFSVYMTDTIGLAAGAAGLIMFIGSLWDAINDPMMGIIADRTKSKWGRYRPYFLPAPILLTLFGTLMWMNPDLSQTGKWWWVLAMQIGFGMTTTMYTMPQMSILPAHVKSDEHRNKIITFGAVSSALMFTIGTSFGLDLKAFFEKTLGVSNGWVPLMLILGALACVSFWGLFATSREKYIEPIPDRPMSQDLKRILRHKELAPFIIVWVLASVGYGLSFASSVYYLMYYYQRPDLIGTYMFISSPAGLLSMMVVMPLTLKYLKTAQKALTFSVLTSSIFYIILFFFGKSSFILLCVLSFCASLFATMQNALVNVLVNDAIDYIQFTEGISANGLISSIKGFAQKCGGTITNSGILFILGLTGYVANEIGNQNGATMFALNFLKFGAPVVLGLIMLLALRFNPVDKHRDDITAMKALIRDHSEENHEA
ncbi:MFS transporter [Streptococcus moroccensis]|uniref:Na+/melibiose symporter-like transporter n=1 Tax=Streptococcus moroccensis TaxID=1451356 RepID=A0ABT9YQW4_9STRE|nr:MFS transporter [Streptococcus moroccensis]MDQ0222124.1 Na+/melibiose symporter-like transporter [Streptococcus moroccensis]